MNDLEIKRALVLIRHPVRWSKRQQPPALNERSGTVLMDEGDNSRTEAPILTDYFQGNGIQKRRVGRTISTRESEISSNCKRSRAAVERSELIQLKQNYFSANQPLAAAICNIA